MYLERVGGGEGVILQEVGHGKIRIYSKENIFNKKVPQLHVTYSIGINFIEMTLYITK